MTEKITKVSQLIGVSFEDWPSENKPRGFNDLSYSDQHEDTVLHARDEILEHPDLLVFWSQVVALAKKSELLKVEGNEILRVNDADVVEAKIQKAKDSYEREKGRLFNALEKRTLEGNKWPYSSYLSAERLEFDKENLQEFLEDSDA